MVAVCWKWGTQVLDPQIASSKQRTCAPRRPPNGHRTRLTMKADVRASAVHDEIAKWMDGKVMQSSRREAVVKWVGIRLEWGGEAGR